MLRITLFFIIAVLVLFVSIVTSNKGKGDHHKKLYDSGDDNDKKFLLNCVVMVDGQPLPALPATPGAGGDRAEGETSSESPQEAPSSRSAKGPKAKKSKKAKRDAPLHNLQLLCDIDPESKEGQELYKRHPNLANARSHKKAAKKSKP